VPRAIYWGALIALSAWLGRGLVSPCLLLSAEVGSCCLSAFCPVLTEVGTWIENYKIWDIYFSKALEVYVASGTIAALFPSVLTPC